MPDSSVLSAADPASLYLPIPWILPLTCCLAAAGSIHSAIEPAALQPPVPFILPLNLLPCSRRFHRFCPAAGIYCIIPSSSGFCQAILPCFPRRCFHTLFPGCLFPHCFRAPSRSPVFPCDPLSLSVLCFLRSDISPQFLFPEALYFPVLFLLYYAFP